MQMEKNYARPVMVVKLSVNIPLHRLWHEPTHQVDHGKTVLQKYRVLYHLKRINFL